MRSIAFAAALIPFGALPDLCCAQVYPPIHFEEHDFGPGSITVIQGGWGIPGGALLVGVPSGGNPDAAGDVNITVAPGNPGPLYPNGSTTFGVFLRNTWSLDPAALGGITSLSYSLDSRFVASSIGGGCQCSGESFMLRQGARLYTADAHATSVAWGTRAVTGLVATSFNEVLFGNPIFFDTSSHPNFSATGAPLSIGFSRGNSNSPPGFAGYNLSTRADNLLVTAVPCMRLSTLSAEHRTCTAAPAPMSFDADPAYPVSTQWQIDDPKNPGQWLTLADGPLGNGLTFTGTATPSLTVTPTGAQFPSGVVRSLRCVVSNACSTAYRATTLRTCIADFTCDGIVNSTDVGEFINAWFADQVKGSLTADWDHNGIVNSTDVGEFINSWFEDQANGCGS